MISNLLNPERTPVLAILGIVLVSVSPVGVLMGESVPRFIILAMGFALLFASLLTKLVFYRENKKPLLYLLGVVLVIETSCMCNLLRPLDLRMFVFRWVCYGMSTLGILLGRDAPERESYGSFTVRSVVPSLIAGGAILWILSASSAMSSPSRFSGDTDELSAVGVGYTFGILATASWALMLTERSLGNQFLHLAASLLAVSACITSGSRGSFVAIISVFFIGGIVNVRSFEGALRYGLFAMLAVLLSALAIVFVPFLRSQAEFLISRFDFLSSGHRDAAILERDGIRQFYIDSMSSWITFGFSGYDHRYPHNFFMECAVRFGLLGFLLSLLVTAIAVKALFSLQVVRGDSIGAVVTLTGLFTLIVAQFNLALEVQRCLWLFAGYWSVKDCAARERLLFDTDTSTIIVMREQT